MGVISALVSIALLIYLVLRIARLVGGSQTTITTSNQGGGTMDGRPKLPARTEDEIEQLLGGMPSKWVTYPGASPPLNLLVRGLTEELYRRFMRGYFDTIGLQEHIDSLPASQRLDAMGRHLPEINARAYVVDWSGAQYPNGQPLPYTLAHLAALMRQDAMLAIFVPEEAGKLGAW